MQETSSRPVKAKAICDQKFTVSQFQAGMHVGPGEVGHRTVLEIDQHRDDHKHRQGHIGSNATCVLEPFAYVEADNIQDDGNDQEHNRDHQEEGTILRER